MTPLLLLLLIAGTDWTTVLPTAVPAVARLEVQASDSASLMTCSGAVINASAGFLVTAAHCVEGKQVAITVNGRHAEVVRSNRLLDLAVVRFTPSGETALPLAKDAPRMGAEIAVMGFAFGSRQAQAQPGHVAAALEDAEQRMRVAVDIIFGDSGGPCLNARGELVGITSAVKYRGPSHLGLVIPLEIVRGFVEPYLPKDSK